MVNALKSPFLTTEEAAEYLRIEPKTLHNMRWRGQGPNYHKHGGRVFYHVRGLLRWSLENRILLQ